MDSAWGRYHQLATCHMWLLKLTLAGNLSLWAHKLDRSALKNKAKAGGNVANATKNMTHIEHESMNIYINEHAMDLTSGKFRERVNQEMNTGSSMLCSVLWVVLCKQVAWRLRCSARIHAGWRWCYNSRHHRCLNAACKFICTMITMP